MSFHFKSRTFRLFSEYFYNLLTMKKLIIILLLIGIAGIGFLIIRQKPTSSVASSSNPQGTLASSSYTLSDVAQHNSDTSCWTVVNGSVYDMTPYTYQHPGGPAEILRICGKDGSSLFSSQHGGQGEPMGQLEQLRLGDLRTQ